MENKKVISVNPDILVWARKEFQIERADAAGVLNVEEKAYEEWENSGKDIPIQKLKEISKLFKRQLSCFFLPKTPKKVKQPTDHRNLKVCNSRLSKETILAIRHMRRYQSVLLELNGKSYYRKKYAWLEEFEQSFNPKKRIDNEDIANWVREKMGLTIEAQFKVSTPYDAYKLWRMAIEENLGIAVFQTKMPLDEIQGFCSSDEIPYCITVNNALIAPTGRIFTLVHELAHILKNQSSLCYPEKVDDNQRLELECNSFAGKLLMPSDTISPVFTSDAIYEKAKKLKVSSEAYLRRMKSLKIVSDREFFVLLEEIRSKVVVSNKFIPRLTQIQKSMNSRGKHLFNTIIDASRSNRISYSSASDVLGIKINHFVNL